MNNNFVSKAYYISTDESKFNNVVHKLFSKEAYCCENSPFKIIENNLKSSICFEICKKEGLTGFAPLITYYTTYHYLAGQFILPAHQRKRLSEIIIEEIMSLPGTYEKFSFRPPEESETLMEIFKLNTYKTE